jgi:hypothetical protein
MARGRHIAVRLFLPTGEETIQWSQANPRFLKAVKPCIDARGAERERLTVERVQYEQEQQAQAERERQERIRYNIENGNPADDTIRAM